MASLRFDATTAIPSIELLREPLAICSLPSGKTLFADGNRIIASDDSDQMWRYAGSIGSGYIDGDRLNARFSGIQGMCLSPDGDLFVSDTGNHCIRLVKRDGSVSLYAGYPRRIGKENGSRLESSFYAPKGICLDLNGDLIVADCGNNVVRRISRLTNEVSHIAGNGEFALFDGWTTTCSFSHPHTVCLGYEGEIIVITELKDHSYACIPAIFPDGRVTFIHKTTSLIPFTSCYINYHNGTMIVTSSPADFNHMHRIIVDLFDLKDPKPMLWLEPEKSREAEAQLQTRIHRESPYASIFDPPTIVKPEPTSSANSSLSTFPSETDINTSHFGIPLSPRLALYSQDNIRRFLSLIRPCFTTNDDDDENVKKIMVVRPGKDAYRYIYRAFILVPPATTIKDVLSIIDLYSLFKGTTKGITLIGPDGIALGLTELIHDVMRRFETLESSTYISALPTGYTALPSQPEVRARRSAKPFGDSYFRVADLRGPFMPRVPRLFRLGRTSLAVTLNPNSPRSRDLYSDSLRILQDTAIFQVEDGFTFQKLALFAANQFNMPSHLLRLLGNQSDIPKSHEAYQARERAEADDAVPPIVAQISSSLPVPFFIKSSKSTKAVRGVATVLLHLSSSGSSTSSPGLRRPR